MINNNKAMLEQYNVSKLASEEKLKALAQNKNDKLLKEQTDSFEALLLKFMLDSAMKMDNPLYPKAPGDEIYASMYKDTLSKELSGNFGYSEMLFNFLKEQEKQKTMKKSKHLKRPYLKRSHLKHSDKASSFKGLLKKEDNVISLENFKPKESEDLLENFSNKKDMQELLGLLNQFILQSYKVEKEFKDYKALYEWVIEILPQAIWVVNENGSFFYKNSLANQSHEVFNKAKLENFNTEIEHENKSYLVQQNSIQGKQIITATDISAQKRQERLASMGKISAHLAHEIRNPVGSISLLASVLLKHANEKTKPIVVELQKALWRVERIIKATLLFSKGIQANRTKQSLKTLESDLKEALNCYTYSKDIDFLFNFSDEEGRVF